MKNLLKFLVCIALFAFFSSTKGYSQSEVIKQFAENLQQGRTDELVKNFSDKVELNFDGDRKSVSKSESISLFNAFMGKHPLTKFEYVHKGSAGSSGFAIAKYIGGDGSYRVVIKTEGNLIEKIDITKE